MSQNCTIRVSESSSSANPIDAKLEMTGSQLCPNCGHGLDTKPDWVGLPAGVKFDPTDQELIDHLEAKVSSHGLSSHPLIDEFIPTIDGEDGICYTHPEKLPGVTRDGRSRHFFHRPSRAYTTGTRKRRKILGDQRDVRGGETRWHKTGKTRAVVGAGGRQKGCKKILVLYTNFGKHRKPEKTNWVMHQYHLGEAEEEREGELVVSKVFYQTQPRQCAGSGKVRGAAGGESGTASGSCSSSKEAISQLQHRHHQQQHQQQQQMSQSDSFSFAPFRKTFDEVGREGEEGDGSRQRPVAAASFHITQPTNPISAAVSPASMVLEDPFHVTRILSLTAHQNIGSQINCIVQQQQQQQKMMKRSSGAGLEEMIMGCTSTDNKSQETPIQHPQETEWLKYSYWSPDNQDQHG
ncbi:hypothetical protein HPP92_003949 [Vanilla planifolia]|uniref:NAC domain-containing protein n=1 Tax=Vanilla planifolia TaxID=51239 RepID=A0A835RYL5_VANPL|nr:hypothetical protein HPP92_003949 [Vanilla planifolia]